MWSMMNEIVTMYILKFRLVLINIDTTNIVFGKLYFSYFNSAEIITLAKYYILDTDIEFHN